MRGCGGKAWDDVGAVLWAAEMFAPMGGPYAGPVVLSLSRLRQRLCRDQGIEEGICCCSICGVPRHGEWTGVGAEGFGVGEQEQTLAAIQLAAGGGEGFGAGGGGRNGDDAEAVEAEVGSVEVLGPSGFVG